MIFLNTTDPIPNEFLICRRSPENKVHDTSIDKETRIIAFMNHFEYITSNNIPSYIRGMININELHLEYRLEQIRQQHFTNYPSRLSCSFCSLGRYEFASNRHILIPLPQSKIIKCDMQTITFLRGNQSFINDDILISYWQGRPLIDVINFAENPIWEYLIEGPHIINPLSD